MTQQIESQNATAGRNVVRFLRRSRFAVRCVFAFFVLLALFSASAFVFQVLERDEFGELFRDQPGAWPHLLGHLLRSVVGAGLAWCLLRYLRALKRSINADQCEAPELFQSLALWWNGLAICGLALVLYGAWVALVTGPPIVGRPLSPRLKAERPDKATVKLEFRLAELGPGEGLTEVTVDRNSRTIFLHKEPLLTNQDIAEARVVLDEFDVPAVEVKFVPAVHQKVREATEAHRGKPLAIIVDGRVVTAPIVQWRIGGGALIQGAFSREEAERIAKGLSGRE